MEGTGPGSMSCMRGRQHNVGEDWQERQPDMPSYLLNKILDQILAINVLVRLQAVL